MSELQLTPFKRNAELSLAFASTDAGTNVNLIAPITIGGGFLVTHQFSGSMPVPTALGILLIGLDEEGDPVDPEFDIDAIGREDLDYFGFSADGYATGTITVNVDDGDGTVDVVFTAQLNLATGELEWLNLSLANGSCETNMMDEQEPSTTDLFAVLTQTLKEAASDSDGSSITLYVLMPVPPGILPENLAALKQEIKTVTDSVVQAVFSNASGGSTPAPEAPAATGTGGDGGQPEAASAAPSAAMAVQAAFPQLDAVDQDRLAVAIDNVVGAHAQATGTETGTADANGSPVGTSVGGTD